MDPYNLDGERDLVLPPLPLIHQSGVAAATHLTILPEETAPQEPCFFGYGTTVVLQDSHLEQFIPGIPYLTQPKLKAHTPYYSETTTTKTVQKVVVVDEKDHDMTTAQMLVKLQDLPHKSNLPKPNSMPTRGLSVTNQSSGEDHQPIINSEPDTHSSPGLPQIIFDANNIMLGWSL
jgi:hypothetical protein